MLHNSSAPLFGPCQGELPQDRLWLQRGFGLVFGFIEFLNNSCDNTSRIIITHRLEFTVFTVTLGSGLQHCNVLRFHIQRLLPSLVGIFSYSSRAKLIGYIRLFMQPRSQYSVRLSAHPNDLVVNYIMQPDNNRRLRRHLLNDLPTRFLV
jgi:hypothetical protein